MTETPTPNFENAPSPRTMAEALMDYLRDKVIIADVEHDQNGKLKVKKLWAVCEDLSEAAGELQEIIIKSTLAGEPVDPLIFSLI